jgi:hypothetical protein
MDAENVDMLIAELGKAVGHLRTCKANLDRAEQVMLSAVSDHHKAIVWFKRVMKDVQPYLDAISEDGEVKGGTTHAT